MQSRWEKQESANGGANAMVAKNSCGVTVLPLMCLCILHRKSLDSGSSFLPFSLSTVNLT